MGRGTALVRRADRGNRHLLCRCGLRFPRQLRKSCRTGDRAAVGGMGHLHRPLLPGRAAAEPAGPILRRADGGARSRPARPPWRVRLLQGSQPGGSGAGRRGPGGEDRDAAVREHIANFRMPAFITEFRYHNDGLPYDREFTPASFSPCHYAHQIPSDVAVLSVSGWMDGAGYQNGAIARFLTLPNRNKHLLLGPWDHGARINVSPWRRGRDSRIFARWRIVALFRHLPDGAEDRALTGSAGALFL